ncbi:IS701 family transposase [Streptomyces sp. NPDC056039]|uniref:IS701 family transposase n=1 Tax=Streptomyces sp. NPDC056039 TaxID=3345687 RepID=UPI0035D5BCAA
MVRAISSVAPGRSGSSARRASSGAFDTFIAEIFERLPRADQRGWAHVYTRGLLVTPGRKTVRRLAESVSDSATAAQALHQFVNASPWDWEPVRARLADWVVRRSRPRALVIATAVLPKRGDRSCGVHRRFVPRDGRTVNCQVGVGAFLAVEQGTVPVDWRLLLPGRWAEEAEARGRAGSVPAAGAADALASDLVDGAGPGGVPVVADLLGFADTGALVGGLAGRGRRFVVAVPDDFVVHPDRPALLGPGSRAGADTGGVSARSLLTDHPARVATGVVRLPGIPVALRLIGEPGGGRIWLTDLVDRSPREVLALARLHTGALDTVERLADDFGLRAFEGRSFAGWHHHKTLVSAAYAYSVLGSTAPAHTPHRPRTTRPPHRTRTSTNGGRAGTAPGRAPGAPARPLTAPGRSLAAPTRTAEPSTRAAGARGRAGVAPPWSTAGSAGAAAGATHTEAVAGGAVGVPERGSEVPTTSARPAGARVRTPGPLTRDAGTEARTAVLLRRITEDPVRTAGDPIRTAEDPIRTAEDLIRTPEPPSQADAAAARTPVALARAAGAAERTPVAPPRPTAAPPRTPAAPARISTAPPAPVTASAQPPSPPAQPSAPPGPTPASARRTRSAAPASHPLPTPIRTES